MTAPFDIFLVAPPGLEPVLLDEVIEALEGRCTLEEAAETQR